MFPAGLHIFRQPRVRIQSRSARTGMPRGTMATKTPYKHRAGLEQKTSLPQNSLPQRAQSKARMNVNHSSILSVVSVASDPCLFRLAPRPPETLPAVCSVSNAAGCASHLTPNRTLSRSRPVQHGSIERFLSRAAWHDCGRGPFRWLFSSR